MLAVFALATLVLAQDAAPPAGRGGRGRGRGAAQPPAVREYTIAEIPGVIAAGAKWTLAWQGTDPTVGGEPVPEVARSNGGNADGLVGMKDGSLLFAQEQTSEVIKLDKNDKSSVFLRDTHGTGSLAIDSKGRIFGDERTCTDPGPPQKPADCKEATAVAMLAPQHKTIADNIDGKSLGRLNDLVVDKKGGIYFNGAGTFYVDPHGKVITIGEPAPFNTNGIILSRDEKTLYVTNGGGLVAFDIQPDGSVKNQREFAKFVGGGGDGSTIDSEGRLYVTTPAGVQVFGPDGKALGIIQTPRNVISVAFAGPDKKTLYIVGAGALGPDGKEFIPPGGVRNDEKTIFKIQMIAQGFKGRAK